MIRTCVDESVTLFRDESSCVLILKDNTLKIRCSCFHVFVLRSLLFDDKIKVVSFGILCVLLLKLGKATYGHSVKRLMATPVLAIVR